MNKDRIKYLLSKGKNSELTEDELFELDLWYKSFHSNPNFLDTLSETEIQEKKQAIWTGIHKQKENFNKHRAVQNRTFKINLYLKIAAAILVVCTTSIILFHTQTSKNNTETSFYDSLEEIQSGGNRATLTLSDGRTLDLNELATGDLLEKPGLRVTKTEDGLLTYTRTSSKGVTASKAFNKIRTPMGGQYKITLSDGSLVWLNAGSTLEYPEEFDAQKRIVKLSGEAYFEIAQETYPLNNKNIRKPFIVQTTDQEIEVLGTHFNVKAYHEDSFTKTTLLEGRVKVTGLKDGIKTTQETILKEGQAAIWNQNTLTTKTVNSELDIAWKNGKFIFSGENIKTLMTNISRWYNVEVDFEGDLSEINFEGSVSKYETIAEVLRKLELTGTVKFKIVPIKNQLGQERRIIIMP